MRVKIFLAIIAVAFLAIPVFGETKAEIQYYPLTEQYYLKDPVTQEKLSSYYDQIIVEEGHYVGHRWGLRKEILDMHTGEPIPSSYHEIYLRDGLLIGVRGARKYILDSETKKRQSSGYHEIYYRDGLLIGELGACSYILNSETKRRASKGYHEIYFQDGKLIGKLGAKKEHIER